MRQDQHPMDATARIRQIRRRELSARELVQVSLQRIRSLDPQLGAFLSVDPEGALAAADEVDRRLDRGEEVGPLAGMPLAVKDNLATPGLPTTCASRMLQGWCAPYEAPANPDLVLATDELDVEACVERIVALLKAKGLLPMDA